MIRRIALVIAFLLVIGVFAYNDQDTPGPVTCGQATGGYQLTDRGITIGIRIGEGLRKWADESKQQANADELVKDVKHAIDRVIIAWLKATLFSAHGKKLPSDVTGLQRKAAAERQAAEDQCAPCPTGAPVPPVGGTDPRVMLTVAQSTGTESESIVRGAVKIADQRGYGYSEKLAIVEAGLVESGLKLLDFGHSSSVGWLQLIDTNGTYEQRMSIEYPANWFYDEMERLVPDHANTPPGDIAAMVQRPREDLRGKYAEREEDARKWLDRLGESPTDELSDVVGAGCSVDPTTPDGDDGSYETADFSSYQNPRSVAQAIEYMKAQGSTMGTKWPTGGCLHWVGAAYGHPGTYTRDGSFFAVEQWRLAPNSIKHLNDTTAPRGALLFWDTGSGRAGHIAISNGDGKVWSTDQPARGEIGLVPFSTFSGYGDYLGWMPPFFVNQTKVIDSRAVQA